MSATLQLTLDDVSHGIEIRGRRPTLRVAIDGVTHELRETAASDGDSMLLELGGRRYEVVRTREGDRVHLRIGGRTFSVGYSDAISEARQAAGGDAVVRADMPGVVVAVHRDAGESVGAGDTLLVIESMKMQISIKAPRDGVIEVVHVAVAQTFDKGAALVALADDAADAAP